MSTEVKLSYDMRNCIGFENPIKKTDIVCKKTDIKTAIICITEKGIKIAEDIASKTSNTDIYFQNRGIKELCGKLFLEYDCIVFISACGIAVRCIAPFIKSKLEDPAVIVVDENGKNIISLLSGHIGGANEFALYISEITGANPVITTATDSSGKSSADMIASEIGAYIENIRENVKTINASIVNGKRTGLYIDDEYREYINDINTEGFEIIKNPDEIYGFDAVLHITDRIVCDEYRHDKKYKMSDERDTHIVKLIPRKNVAGVGCRKDTDSEKFREVFVEFCRKNNIHPASICKVGSIELKRNEKCIKDISDRFCMERKFFSVEELSKYDDMFEGSDFVKKTTGVKSVSAPSAYIMSGGNIITDTFRHNGITITIGRKRREMK